MQWGYVEVSESLLFMRMLKQRGDAGRHTWPLWFEPQSLTLREMELRQVRQP